MSEEYKTSGLTFTEAYAAMRAGNKVHRKGSKGWWGYNTELQSEYIHLPIDGREINYGKIGLTMKACTMNDWELIPDDEGKTIEYSVKPEKQPGLTFTEAYGAMKAGSKVRRHGFKGYWAISEETGEEYVSLPNGKTVTYGKIGLTMRSCAANDWEIIEDEEPTTSPEASQAAQA